jgi:hypothetical protein
MTQRSCGLPNEWQQWQEYDGYIFDEVRYKYIGYFILKKITSIKFISITAFVFIGH